MHLIKHFEGTKNQDIYRKIFRFRGRRKNVLEISQYYLNRIKKDLLQGDFGIINKGIHKGDYW